MPNAPFDLFIFRAKLTHNVQSTQLDMQVGVIFDAVLVQYYMC